VSITRLVFMPCFAAKFFTRAEGAFPSLEYRVRFFYGEMGVPVSPWHNIPYKNKDGSFNFVCEIPKWTRRKMEIATGEPFNAIKQDVKNGKLREYAWGGKQLRDVRSSLRISHGGVMVTSACVADMMFNYGAIPQTWESPEVITEGTGKPGDNDPLDAIEIGNKQWSTGSIVSVKVLGVIALIDSNETDWKLITISTQDPLADKVCVCVGGCRLGSVVWCVRAVCVCEVQLNEVEDVDAHLPGLIDGKRFATVRRPM
jgi:inorganic pyrophosphatase